LHICPNAWQGDSRARFRDSLGTSPSASRACIATNPANNTNRTTSTTTEFRIMRNVPFNMLGNARRNYSHSGANYAFATSSDSYIPCRTRMSPSHCSTTLLFSSFSYIRKFVLVPSLSILILGFLAFVMPKIADFGIPLLLYASSSQTGMVNAGPPIWKPSIPVQTISAARHVGASLPFESFHELKPRDNNCPASQACSSCGGENAETKGTCTSNQCPCE
jgi:hypothetical protein